MASDIVGLGETLDFSDKKFSFPADAFLLGPLTEEDPDSIGSYRRAENHPKNIDSVLFLKIPPKKSSDEI